jgi:hypothetical protein
VRFKNCIYRLSLNNVLTEKAMGWSRFQGKSFWVMMKNQQKQSRRPGSASLQENIKMDGKGS